MLWRVLLVCLFWPWLHLAAQVVCSIGESILSSALACVLAASLDPLPPVIRRKDITPTQFAFLKETYDLPLRPKMAVQAIQLSLQKPSQRRTVLTPVPRCPHSLDSECF